MGVPTSEGGYTAAMPRRENHEVHKGVWWHWEKKSRLSYTKRVVKIPVWQFGKWYLLTDCHKMNTFLKSIEKYKNTKVRKAT